MPEAQLYLFESACFVAGTVGAPHNVYPDATFPPLQSCIVHQLPRLGTR